VKKLPKVTFEKVLAEEPCWIFDEPDPLQIVKNYEKLKTLFKGKKNVTALTILQTRQIKGQDRAWAASRFVPQAFIDKVLPPYEGERCVGHDPATFTPTYEKTGEIHRHNIYDVFDHYVDRPRKFLKDLEKFVAGEL
jgi:hypothetical protein